MFSNWLFKRERSQKDMPLFTGEKTPFLMIDKMQDILKELKIEIIKNKCPKCGFSLEGDKRSGDVYNPLPHLKETSKNLAEKNVKDKSGEQSNFSDELRSKKYIAQLEDEKASLNNHCKLLKKEDEKKIAKIANLEIIISEKDNEIANLEKYHENIGKLKDVIAEKDDEIKTLNETRKDTDDQRTKLQQLINSKEKEEKCRNAKVEELQELLYKHEAIDKEKERQIQKLNKSIDDIKYTLENQQKENSELIRKHNSTLLEKEREISHITDRCRQLEVQFETYSRKEISVGFHTTLAPAMSSLILDGLIKELSGRLAVEKVDLVRRPFYGSTDLNCPLLAICVNVSRIGTDAKEVLKGIPKTSNFKDVALLVFHHKEAHALPSQSSDKILTGTDFNHLGTIIDFAFLSQRGIYECDMNMMGIERIVSFLLQYKARKT